MSGPTAPLHADVAAALARRSLADAAEGEGGGGDELRRFTVARTEALLHLRAIPREPWRWTVGLLQAALAVARVARAQVIARDEEAGRVVEIHVAVPGAALATVELGDLLLAALDEAPGELGEPTPELGLVRWRVGVAAALNAALSQEPDEITLVTPSGSRILRRRDGQAQPGRDPFREVRGDERSAEGTFSVKLREPRPSFGRRLAAFLALRGPVEDAIDRVWRSAMILVDDDADIRKGIDLQRRLPGVRARLGDHAIWGMVPELGGPWLVRDGLKIFDLRRTLSEVNLDPSFFAGWIECPSLRLTADLGGVARDGAYELLMAWLFDAQAHAFPGEGGLPKVIWPTELAHVVAASGRPVPIEVIRERALAGSDFPFEWAHTRELVPERALARVFVIWPSELAALRRAIPELRPVPQRNLGDHMRQARIDVSGLAGRSLPPLPIDLAEPQIRLSGGATLSLDLEAYVHAQSAAVEGSVVILAYGRRIAQSRGDRRNLPGVTALCRIDDAAVATGVALDELREDRQALDEILERCRVALEAARERLLAHAFSAESPWEVPLVRASASALDPAALGLAYRRGEGGLRLSWREGELGGLAVGATRGGAPRTLTDALICLRDQGGILVEEPGKRWPALEPADADARIWSLTPHGRELCERALGPRALWPMPTALEGQLRPIPAAEQRSLLLIRRERERLMAKAAKEPRARIALVAHLLVARALGVATEGLERDPLFTRYDPRALSPSRLVSLDEIAAEDPPPRLCPAGAVGRGLVEVVIEASPGESFLLHELLGLAPAFSAEGGAEGGAASSGVRPAIRRHAHDRPPIVILPVADEVAAGALRIDDPEARAAIALWAGGLHIDDLTLPHPLECIGGRLWLTRAGLKAGTERLAAQLRGLARELVRRAVDERHLHPPESREAAAIAALIERLRAAPPRERAWIADLLPAADASPNRQAALAASLSGQALRRLLGGGGERLTLALRQALARPVVLETAFLSWRPARIVEGPETKGRWVLELGKRSATIQAALDRQANLAATFDAAALILATIMIEGRAQGIAGCEPVAEEVAVYRLLALVFAHT